MADEQQPKKKRGWKFWGAIIVVCLLIGSCMSGKKDDSNTTTSSQPAATTEQKATSDAKQPPAEKQVNYTEVTIDQLINDVKGNAAKAQKTYKGKDLKIVGGHVGTIDSDADYIGLDSDQDFTMVNIQCFARGKNAKALKEQIIDLNKNQRLVIYGRCTDVGELMGYMIDMDKMEIQ